MYIFHKFERLLLKTKIFQKLFWVFGLVVQLLYSFQLLLLWFRILLYLLIFWSLFFCFWCWLLLMWLLLGWRILNLLLVRCVGLCSKRLLGIGLGLLLRPIPKLVMIPANMPKIISILNHHFYRRVYKKYCEKYF